MDSGRLEAFSDGVFAVAITLLALDLIIAGPKAHDPHPQLVHNLGHEWPSFFAYVVSFIAVGIIWVNHHTLFKNFAEIDRPLLFLNLLLLFFVVSIPFATSTAAAYLRADKTDASLAVAIYQGIFEGMSITFGLLFWWAIRRDHLKVSLSADQARRASIRFGLGNLGYIAAIGIAFVSPVASLALAGVVAIYYVFEQTPARAQPVGAETQGPPEDNAM